MCWRMSTSNYWIEKSKLECNVYNIPSFCSKIWTNLCVYLFLKTERCRRYSKLIIAQRGENRQPDRSTDPLPNQLDLLCKNKIRIPFLPLPRKEVILLCYPFQERISIPGKLRYFCLAAACFLSLCIELCFICTN